MSTSPALSKPSGDPPKQSDAQSTSDSKDSKQIKRTNDLPDALASAGTQTNSKGTSDEVDKDMEIYRVAGKKAVALLDPFTTSYNAFHTGIQLDQGGQINNPNLDPKVISQHLHFYNGILTLIPSLRTELDTIELSRLKKIMRAVHIAKGMSNGHSADLASVKYKGLKYVPEDMYNTSDALDPPIPDVKDKSMRGIFHPQLARFLCPRRDLDEFDIDPEAYTDFS